MANEIKELMDKVVKSDVKLSELLRHAMLIAKKHDNQNFLSWVNLEMNGYEEGKNCPEYRHIHGTPKMLHPYNGRWYYYTHSNSQSQKNLSNNFVVDSIAKLESLAENPQKDGLIIYYSTEIQKNLSKTTDPSADKFGLAFSASNINGILDSIRNELLNQLSDLDANTEDNSNTELLGEFFPPKLMSRLPTDIRQLADDFNFNFSHNHPYACMLILRRILPLSIVRRYQRDDKENDIKKDGDFLETKALLKETQPLIRQRLYKDLLSCKMLLDASQHSYTFCPEINDVREAATVLRLFLDELFSENIN